MDVCILDNAGNLIDACAVAMMAALLYFRKSAVEILDNNEVRLMGSHESEPTPLNIHHVPLSCTLLVFDDGESAVLDPTEREELALDCRLTCSFNVHGELCMLQKLGGVAMSQDALLRFARLAFANVETRIRDLKAVRAFRKRRWVLLAACRRCLACGDFPVTLSVWVALSVWVVAACLRDV